MPGDAEAIWRASYLPFGKATVDEDPDGDMAPFSLHVRFPGQYEGLETGWHYNFFRTYHPATGRYLEADPIGLRGGLSLFLCARANPLRYIDPHGAAVEDRSSPGNPIYFGFPGPDEHFNRNQNNYCPKRPPKGYEGWRHVAGKWRTVRGYECSYDSSGRLLPDTTEASFPRYQNYSFNYAGHRRFTPGHLWQDWIPHWVYWYRYPSQHYPEGLTPIGDSCEPCGDR